MMELKKDFKNVLLKRREIEFFVKDKINPGIAKVSKVISDSLRVPENVIAVKSLKSNFGSDKFFVEAFIYDNEKEKTKLARGKKVLEAKNG